MKLLILITLSNLIGFTASARYKECVKEYITPVSSEVVRKGKCVQSLTLRLDTTFQTYPLLKDNPRRVKYWRGGYNLQIETATTYLRELVDVCRSKIISSNKFTTLTDKDYDFSVKNLNLDLNISESYMLVPMTKAEAQEELQLALIRCEEF